MILFLCHADDDAALWLHGTLTGFGLAELSLVTVEQLVFSRHIVHRLSNAGDTGLVQLADGRVLRAESIRSVVNRVRYLPTQHFARAGPDDRAYATAELGAFLLAWLNGLGGRVLNPPRPFALGGGIVPETSWLYYAASAGLTIDGWRSGSSDSAGAAAPRPVPTHSVVVLDGRVFGPLLPRPVQDGCRRLSVLTGVPLLQVQFHQSREGGWCFTSATGTVDFRTAGQPLARAMGKVLAA